ncbi:MAG: ribose-phosphate pyrophosphokinase [Clostridiales bacterium]|nr:ribose-phosphate pyrophosphokinase [Clostridiales bacterium]
MPTFFTEVFDVPSAVAPLGLIILEGAKDLGNKIDNYLVNWYNRDLSKRKADFIKKDTFILDSDCPRFTTGDGKAVIKDSVRGRDLYIVVDVGNYHCTYNMIGGANHMSPDDHYADLKRIIGAAGGKAERITVVMPLLYGGRQHKRTSRESLDCAQMLQELYAMGVKEIITFDAHDPRVQNAVPLMGFDNFFPTYQILKALTKHFPNLELTKDKFMAVSPDEGAVDRNIYYASVLGVDMGMFYKRRDYSTIVNGRNPIVAHEYIGSSVKGKNIIVADDIIATGDSMLKLCTHLKKNGAKNIFLNATFALFTEGTDKFQQAYEDGLFTAVLSTNLTYTNPSLKTREWYIEADLSKYISYIIAYCNQNKSVADLLSSSERINALLKK